MFVSRHADKQGSSQGDTIIYREIKHFKSIETTWCGCGNTSRIGASAKPVTEARARGRSMDVIYVFYDMDNH